MNAEPHSHELRISHSNDWIFIYYGDQSKTIDRVKFTDQLRLTTLEGRLERAVKNIIREHDEESRYAGSIANVTARALGSARKLAPVEASKWGSEQF